MINGERDPSDYNEAVNMPWLPKDAPDGTLALQRQNGTYDIFYPKEVTTNG